jgi:starvation-inducible DNA-binding protein
MKPHIGISEEHLINSSMLLSSMLANEMVLYTKTRKAHWNVTGESFMELHLLFEKFYTQLEKSIDEIAERIGKMGSKTIGTLNEFINLASLSESPGVYGSSMEILKELLNDNESIIILLRENIALSAGKNNDAGTADFITGLMEQHETAAWILRRYLA